MQDGAEPEVVKAALRDILRERRKLSEADEDNFNILDTRQLGETLSGTTRIMTMLLGAVAAVSLLVGGIGIMNIMLVSVTERTREIGLRLAIGALEREVLLQFLIEAVVLAALGGVVGLVLALLASVGLSMLMNIPFVFGLGINLMAFAFSAAIGVLFGFVPARRAARSPASCVYRDARVPQRRSRPGPDPPAARAPRPAGPACLVDRAPDPDALLRRPRSGRRRGGTA
jgi:putative ABC transport system permease protein